MESFVGAALIFGALAAAARIAAAARDPIHPLAVFTVSWIGVFGFAHLRLSETYDEPYYADPFGLQTYVVVFLALASFAGGFVLAAKRLAPPERATTRRRLHELAELPTLAWAALAVYAVATLATWWLVRVAGEVPLFSPSVNTLRQTFQLPYVGYLYNLHILAATLCLMLALKSKPPARRALWLTLAGSSVVMLMFGGVRVTALAALAWGGVYVAYALSRRRRRTAALVAVLGLAIFVAVEAARRREFREAPELQNPRVDTGVLATAWAHTGASFKNLQLTLDRHTPLTMGLNSFDLLRTLIPEARNVGDELSYLYGTHNTPTFLGFLYFDFGFAGVLFMPGIYGALAAFAYNRFLRHGNLFWLVVHIDFFLAVLLSFRTHRFLGNNLIFFAGTAWAVQLLLDSRRSPTRGTAPPTPRTPAAAKAGTTDPPFLPRGA